MNRASVLVGLALVALMGCKKGPVTKLQSAPPPALEQGWTTFESTTFTLAAPSNYKSKPPPPIQVPGLDDQVAAGAVEKIQSDKTEGVLMTLWDWNVKATIGEQLARMEVKRESGYNDLKSAIEEAQSSIGEKQYEKVTLPVGEAALFKSSTQSVGGDDIHEVAYVLVHNGDMYLFSWHVTTQPRAGIEQASAAMMQTFRVK